MNLGLYNVITYYS